MDYGKDTQIYILIEIWFTQLVLVTIKMIGSLLRLPGMVLIKWALSCHWDKMNVTVTHHFLNYLFCENLIDPLLKK